MDRLIFNLKLNALIAKFLEGGGDPTYCASILRAASEEVLKSLAPTGGGT